MCSVVLFANLLAVYGNSTSNCHGIIGHMRNPVWSCIVPILGYDSIDRHNNLHLSCYGIRAARAIRMRTSSWQDL